MTQNIHRNNRKLASIESVMPVTTITGRNQVTVSSPIARIMASCVPAKTDGSDSVTMSATTNPISETRSRRYFR